MSEQFPGDQPGPPPEMPEAAPVTKITGQTPGRESGEPGDVEMSHDTATEQSTSESFGVDIHSDEIFKLAGETLLRALIQCEYEKVTMDLRDIRDRELLLDLHEVVSKRVRSQLARIVTPDPDEPLRFVS